MALQSKIVLLANRFERLRCTHASEKSVAKIVALAFGSDDAVVAAGTRALDCVRDFKQRISRPAPPQILLYPDNPRDLQSNDIGSAIFASNYPAGHPPTECPLDIQTLRRAQDKMPCRCTRTGYRSLSTSPAVPPQMQSAMSGLTGCMHDFWRQSSQRPTSSSHDLFYPLDRRTSQPSWLALASHGSLVTPGGGPTLALSAAPGISERSEPSRTVATHGVSDELASSAADDLGGSHSLAPTPSAGTTGAFSIAERMREALASSGASRHSRTPEQTSPKKATLKRKKAAAARAAPKKRPAVANAAAKKRPAQNAPTRVLGNLSFPGAKKRPPLHFGTSRVYSDAKQQRWRLYSRPGDKVEALCVPWQPDPKAAWATVVRKMKELNP